MNLGVIKNLILTKFDTGCWCFQVHNGSAGLKYDDKIYYSHVLISINTLKHEFRESYL